MRDWLKNGDYFLSAEIQQMILQSLLLQGPRLLPHVDVELRAADFILDTCRSSSHPFPLPFIPHTLVALLLEQNRRKHQAYGVGAKSQPQPWIKALAHRMERCLHDPETEKPKLRKWFRVHEAHTNNQCVSIRPDLTNKFKRYWFISDLKVDFSNFNVFKSLLTVLWL